MFVTSIHQFTDPLFFIKIFIYLLFFLNRNHPTFSKSFKRGHHNATHSIIKTIITPNFVKKIFINWWIDVTKKIYFSAFAEENVSHFDYSFKKHKKIQGNNFKDIYVKDLWKNDPNNPLCIISYYCNCTDQMDKAYCALFALCGPPV